MGFSSLLFISLLVPQFIVVYYFNKKNIQNTGVNKGSYNTANATQGFIFALFTSIVSPFVLYTEYSLGGNNSFATDIIMHVALSFFTCHMVFIVLANNITSEITHHVICMGALFYSLTTQTFGQDLVLTIFLGEITFTHYAKIVAKNMKWVDLEKQLNDLFFYSFSFMRLVVFPIYLYAFTYYADASIFLKLFAIAFVGLGVYYNGIIIRNRKRTQQKKILITQ